MLTEQEKRAIEKAPTTDVQAYDYYLKGRQYFHRFRRKSFDFARQLFARAIVIDPKYALAEGESRWTSSSMMWITEKGDWTELTEITIGSEPPKKYMELTVSRRK